MFVYLLEGQLRHIKTGEPFVFNYREDLHRWNQKRYEALGEVWSYIQCLPYIFQILNSPNKNFKVEVVYGLVLQKVISKRFC